MIIQGTQQKLKLTNTLEINQTVLLMIAAIPSLIIISICKFDRYYWLLIIQLFQKTEKEVKIQFGMI